ncbi:hypothetical protein ON010_g17775 [Phytophthora cinnamomi]|nr:hypothetical protein ON010_g17775 [Phytophthora cinnamomi]
MPVTGSVVRFGLLDDSQLPSERRRYPYFDQALCAIDGTHFRVVVPSDDVMRFRNHKGSITTNALIACDWNLNVCFAYVGAEGSAHDSMVLQWSDFLDSVPEDFYVLADAGYGLSKKVLTPYRSVRYHLKEWAKSSGRPQKAKELYNLRHAKVRNVVEQVIGIMKRRFKALRTCMDYEFFNMKAVIFACISVHNFIRSLDECDLGEGFPYTVRDPALDRVTVAADVPIAFDFRSDNRLEREAASEDEELSDLERDCESHTNADTDTVSEASMSDEDWALTDSGASMASICSNNEGMSSSDEETDVSIQ